MENKATKEKDMTDYRDGIQSLKVSNQLESSLMYSLSLGDKELFHSNLIYWLCTNYKNLMFEIFSEFLDISNDSKEIIGCEREVKNIDVIIHFDKADLYIENKMKCLPNREQLERYQNSVDKKAKDKPNFFLLLSLIEANFDTGIWKKLSYNSLASKLSIIIDRINHPDAEKTMYHKAMLRDYVTMLINITSLTDNFKLNINKSYQDTLDLFPIAQYGKTKLYSLFLNNIYQQIADELHTKISSSLYNPFDKIFRNKRKDNVNELTINDGNFYGKKGQIYIRYFNKNGIHLFLALDGKNYQKGVFCNDVKYIKKVSSAYKYLLKNNRWINFEDIKPKFIVQPKKKRKDILTFEKGKYLYKYFEINTNITIKELIKIMGNDILTMKNVFKK